MNQIILNLAGYKIKGEAAIQSWDNKIVTTKIHEFFVETDSYNEDEIPVSEGIQTLYKEIENAEVEVYKCYQNTLQGRVVECLVYFKTLNI